MNKNLKICFVTSIFGKSDKIKNNTKFGNYDFYLFTDNINYNIVNGWKIIIFSKEEIYNHINIQNNNELTYLNIYMSRYPKFMIWKYFKEKNIHYDIIFYCDGYLYPKSNINWNEYANHILVCESGILQQTRCNNAYKECNDIVHNHKDTKENMTKMENLLTENNFPRDYIIMENTVFGYDPNNAKITQAMEDFWNNYIDHKITYRDQPLWALISWKHNIKPLIVSRFKLKLLFNEGVYKNHKYVL